MFPVLSVVITLDEGELKSIVVETLEKACDQPETNKVLDVGFPDTNKDTEVTTCGLNDCSLDSNATGRCDPKLYITWIGTDIDNHNLVSVNERLTNFNNYNIGAVFEDLIGNDTNMRDGDTVEAYKLSNIKNASARARIENPNVKVNTTPTTEETPKTDETTKTEDNTNTGDDKTNTPTVTADPDAKGQ